VAISAVLVMAASRWLVMLFGGGSGDTRLGVVLVLAFFICLLPYFFEAFYGELLTVHQQGALLSVASTIVTYALVIPFAAIAIFVLHSAFLVDRVHGDSHRSRPLSSSPPVI